MRLLEYLVENNIVTYHGNITISSDVTWEGGDDLMYLEDMFSGETGINYKAGCKLIGDIGFFSTEIISLKGAPSEVTGNFSFSSNKYLKSLQYGPRIVGKDYAIPNCKSLTNFKGIAMHIGGDLIISGCTGIKTLKHLWDSHIEGEIYNDMINNDKLELACDIMSRHKFARQNNYMLVVREAREKGVEEYFK